MTMIIISISTPKDDCVAEMDFTAGERIAVTRFLSAVTIEGCDSDSQALGIYKLFKLLKAATETETS